MTGNPVLLDHQDLLGNVAWQECRVFLVQKDTEASLD